MLVIPVGSFSGSLMRPLEKSVWPRGFPWPHGRARTMHVRAERAHVSLSPTELCSSFASKPCRLASAQQLCSACTRKECKQSLSPGGSPQRMLRRWTVPCSGGSGMPALLPCLVEGPWLRLFPRGRLSLIRQLWHISRSQICQRSIFRTNNLTWIWITEQEGVQHQSGSFSVAAFSHGPML